MVLGDHLVGSPGRIWKSWGIQSRTARCPGMDSRLINVDLFYFTFYLVTMKTGDKLVDYFQQIL